MQTRKNLMNKRNGYFKKKPTFEQHLKNKAKKTPNPEDKSKYDTTPKSPGITATGNPATSKTPKPSPPKLSKKEKDDIFCKKVAIQKIKDAESSSYKLLTNQNKKPLPKGKISPTVQEHGQDLTLESGEKAKAMHNTIHPVQQSKSKPIKVQGKGKRGSAKVFTKIIKSYKAVGTSGGLKVTRSFEPNTNADPPTPTVQAKLPGVNQQIIEKKILRDAAGQKMYDQFHKEKYPTRQPKLDKQQLCQKAIQSAKDQVEVKDPTAFKRQKIDLKPEDISDTELKPIDLQEALENNELFKAGDKEMDDSDIQLSIVEENMTDLKAVKSNNPPLSQEVKSSSKKRNTLGLVRHSPKSSKSSRFSKRMLPFKMKVKRTCKSDGGFSEGYNYCKICHKSFTNNDPWNFERHCTSKEHLRMVQLHSQSSSSGHFEQDPVYIIKLNRILKQQLKLRRGQKALIQKTSEHFSNLDIVSKSSKSKKNSHKKTSQQEIKNSAEDQDSVSEGSASEQNFAADIENLIEEQKPKIDNPNMSWQYRLQNQTTFAQDTKKKYKQHINWFINHYTICLSKQKQQQQINNCIMDYKGSKVSNAAQAQQRAALKWFFTQHLYRFDQTFAPCKIISKSASSAKNSNQHKYWTPEQIKDMLKIETRDTYKRNQMQFAGYLLNECMMRRQDAWSLKWGQFKSDENMVNGNFELHFHQQKNDKSRTITIAPEMRKMALDLLAKCKAQNNIACDDEDKIFQHKDAENFGDAVHRFVRNNKQGKYKKFKTHDMRTSKINQMYGNGHDIEDICDLLGHSSSKITRLYLKKEGLNMRKAAIDDELGTRLELTTSLFKKEDPKQK